VIKKILSASAVLALAATTAAGAATNLATSSITASLNIQSVCSITPPTAPLAFPAVNGGVASTPSTALTLAYNCSSNGTGLPDFGIIDSAITSNTALGTNEYYKLTSATTGGVVDYGIFASNTAAPTSLTGGGGSLLQNVPATANATGTLGLAVGNGSVFLFAQASVPASALPANDYKEDLTAQIAY